MCSTGQISLSARNCIWEHGTSGCSWRGPGRWTTRRGDLLRNTARHDSARWRALLVACCLGIAALVAACGGGDSGSGDSGSSGGSSTKSSTKKVDMAAELKKPATITVWAWTPGTDKAVAMFEAAPPNIKVKLQNVGQGN